MIEKIGRKKVRLFCSECNKNNNKFDAKTMIEKNILICKECKNANQQKRN